MSIRNLFHTISVLILTLSATVATTAEPSLKEIMQDLRDNLVEITDGLLVDDSDRVAQGATDIAQHAPIAVPQAQRISQELGPEMAAFKRFDEQVHALSVAIVAAAIKKDREVMVVDYQAMVNGCLACHAAFKERVAQALNAAP